MPGRLKNYVLLMALGLYAACSSPVTPTLDDEKSKIRQEMEVALGPQLLEKWYPRCQDTVHGGFLSDFDYRWQATGPDNKMIVTQARHIWTTSKAAEWYSDNDIYLTLARHGFHFLKEKMWDAEFGGFYNLVNREGDVLTPPSEGRIIKRAYGNAFAIYGLAAYYKISKDTAVLNLAKDAFRWLDQHSFDPEYGGYFQFMERDGRPMPEGFGHTPPKDQNSSIHLLEAFTELYAVWPDQKLRERLQELLEIIRDTITTDMGYMNLFFYRDWTPLSYRDSTEAVREANHHLDHVSFGHDVETAFLMMEASETLGLEHDDRTLEVGRKMVDHTLQNGWDDVLGGIYDGGYYFKDNPNHTLIRDTKNWWAQSEMLNTLLIMHELYPDDDQAFFEKFKKQWAYCQEYLLDSEHGGWYAGGLDKEPERKTGDKGHIWKGAYHTARSLMNCIEKLKN